MIAKGSAASPGAACGKVCFTQDEALAAKANKEDAILTQTTLAISRDDADRFLPRLLLSMSPHLGLSFDHQGASAPGPESEKIGEVI